MGKTVPAYRRDCFVFELHKTLSIFSHIKPCNMSKFLAFAVGLFTAVASLSSFYLPHPSVTSSDSWVRINLLGYKPTSSKVAIWASQKNYMPQKFELIDEASQKVVYTSSNIEPFGAYGPFLATARLNFSGFQTPGKYLIRIENVVSPTIIINENVYQHTADFTLRYLRQQRSGFNPFLKDSCHTHDGFVLYGEKAGIKDSTHFDASGGWHDASDYLQYATTSANATYNLLMAYRDFPNAFKDENKANGLAGKNGVADVLDEAKWGLQWLLKMHPRENIMFNQLADDRDHISMRMPKEDNQYGKGFERPLYFINGEPQQRGKFMNNTTGTSSTAAKLTSAFALGAKIFALSDKTYANLLSAKAKSALAYANIKKGVTQTVSVRSPYIYAEDNWVDDMELAYATIATGKKANLTTALSYAQQESITPWITKDTANHYQYYPFVNVGHYELAKQTTGSAKTQLINYYKQGIIQVWNRAKNNAFYRGVPFIWCSNNLTVAFTQQCLWYKELSGDTTFSELEQANFDWLFGCNPWGTSMVFGLPNWADTPQDPHSAFTHLKNFSIDGGLVDGPVYSSIYKNLIGIQLANDDEYANFQSDLVVYHDDYGDYSTNEPTMDGTASLIYLLAAFDSKAPAAIAPTQTYKGAIIRGNTTTKKVALVFTGDEFADGGLSINKTLSEQNVPGSFFFTGRFYRNPKFKTLIRTLKNNKNYLGAHSNQHLLYNDWIKRDSLLVTKNQFTLDLKENYNAMKAFGITKTDATYFLPPYEWYNETIANWTQNMGLTLINFSPGTNANADYTYPEMGKSYKSTAQIYQSILDYEKSSLTGLNGFILLFHIGVDPKRTDKMYHALPNIIEHLKQSGYELVTVKRLLKP